MPQATVFVFASLVSVVLLVVPPGASGHALARSPWGPSHNDKHGGSPYSECRASSCQIAYRTLLLTFVYFVVAHYAHDPAASKLCRGLLLVGSFISRIRSFGYQEHEG